jgi:hypothetical protein
VPIGVSVGGFVGVDAGDAVGDGEGVEVSVRVSDGVAIGVGEGVGVGDLTEVDGFTVVCLDTAVFLFELEGVEASSLPVSRRHPVKLLATTGTPDLNSVRRSMSYLIIPLTRKCHLSAGETVILRRKLLLVNQHL